MSLFRVSLPLTCLFVTLATPCLAAPKLKPLASVAAANAAALSTPQAGHYINAMQVYAFADGEVYRLFTAPDRVSDIVLQKGEKLVSIAAGNTLTWDIGNTHSGEGADTQVHILVKPQAAGQTTNLVMTTDRRTYRLDLQSVPATAMAALSWRYADDALLALKPTAETAAAPVPAAAAPTHPEAAQMDLTTLNFDYVLSGDHPAWRPLRVFDDGRRVYIQFPSARTSGDLPPLFALGPDNRPQLLNYRVQGSTYIVDHLISVAELRLGDKHQQVVRIIRAAGDPS